MTDPLAESEWVTLSTTPNSTLAEAILMCFVKFK